MSWGVVVPTCREEKYREFIAAWEPLFTRHEVGLFVVHDGPEKFAGGGWAWPDFPDWVPRGTDMCRSWGIYQAWKAGHEFTLSLDDDVLPVGDPFAEYDQVWNEGAPISEYLSVGALPTYGKQLRGYPYKDRRHTKVSVQYGGWHGVLDYDAATQLSDPQPDHVFHPVVVPVPRGAAVTGCAMNMAWRTSH